MRIKIILALMMLFSLSASAQTAGVPIGPGSNLPLGPGLQGGGGSSSAGGFLLLANGVSFLLLANGTSRLCLSGGCP